MQDEGEAVSVESRQQHAENRALEAIVKLAHSKNVRAMQDIIEAAKLVHGQSGDVRRFVARSTSRGRSWLNFLRKIDGSGWWVTAYKTRKAAEEGK